MADVFSSRKRSQIMSRVRGKGNKATELALITLLRRLGISGWRRGAHVFGKPDFVFPKYRLAIFVDGCFWHGCPRHGTQPTSNRAFWKSKLARNKARDRLVKRTLKQRGWRVLRIWQHALSQRKDHHLTRRVTASRLLRFLRPGTQHSESGPGKSEERFHPDKTPREARDMFRSDPLEKSRRGSLVAPTAIDSWPRRRGGGGRGFGRGWGQWRACQ
jgi:DNA mismatch endonuclease, patch repair protein